MSGVTGRSPIKPQPGPPRKVANPLDRGSHLLCRQRRHRVLLLPASPPTPFGLSPPMENDGRRLDHGVKDGWTRQAGVLARGQRVAPTSAQHGSTGARQPGP
ncbi:unnamed protein product [Urochloa humidicola]